MSTERTETRRGRLVELSTTECWELLEGQSVGRLAWQSGDRPYVVPVNFAIHQGAIWLRTSPYGEIARTALHRQVAFEVDDLQTATRSGHSVVVTGIAEPQRQLQEQLRELDTWVSGTRSLPLRIEATVISGRRVLPGRSALRQ